MCGMPGNADGRVGPLAEVSARACAQGKCKLQQAVLGQVAEDADRASARLHEGSESSTRRGPSRPCQCAPAGARRVCQGTWRPKLLLPSPTDAIRLLGHRWVELLTPWRRPSRHRIPVIPLIFIDETPAPRWVISYPHCVVPQPKGRKVGKCLGDMERSTRS